MKQLFFLNRKGFTVLACALAAVLMFGAVNAPAVVDAPVAAGVPAGTKRRCRPLRRRHTLPQAA